MNEMVILVDENDNETGTEEKIRAHREALLHRAFSIFIRNDSGELLLQKRAKTKYHSGGLWTNACCGHPHPGEDLERAAHRRLAEELGFDCELARTASFLYRAELDSGLFEHEIDHVFTGVYSGGPVAFNREEADGVKWVTARELARELEARPDRFTEWFGIAVRRFPELLENAPEKTLPGVPGA